MKNSALIAAESKRWFAIVVFSGCSLFAGQASAQGCGSVPGGPPNSCPGPASTGGSGGPDSGAGNPINVITGNKYEREVDMPALPGVLGLEIVRHYNSAYSRPGNRNGSLGRGWRLSYETTLFDMNGRVQVMQGDGGRVIFDRDPKNRNLCSTPNPANGKMVFADSGDYIWTWTNGRKLYFSKSGKLYRIQAPTGESVSLAYDVRNVLRRVTDPQGRSLELIYFDAKLPNHFRGVQFIDSPVGRFEYQYGSELPKSSTAVDAQQLLALMVKAKLPAFASDAKTRAAPGEVSHIYHHEDPKNPWALTGISVEAAGADGKPVTSRYSTFGYDGDGRAILSTHANGVDRVTLETPEAGKTVLTNSLGQKTTYLHAIVAGENRLLEVRGAGCTLCGEVNVRYGYNAAGQVTQRTQLNPNGEPVTATRIELDRLGRTIRIARVAFVHGKALPARPTARFEYVGDRFSPSVIARPSVVPGKEAMTRVEYNAEGQPLSVMDIGWVPTFDGNRTAGRIERTTRYRYARVNGSSLLIEIDGPLPNGKTNSPLDSDITVFKYGPGVQVPKTPTSPARTGGLDLYTPSARHNGLVTRIIAPGNFIAEVLERDHAQRPTKVRTVDGETVQLTTTISNWRGAPLDIEMVAGSLRRRLHYDYNAAGQVTSITYPGELRTSFQYDPAGQVKKTILPDGSGVLTEHDTEGRVNRVARVLDAFQPVADSLPNTHFDYGHPADRPSELSEISDAMGVLKRFRYSGTGQVVAVKNALGIESRFDFDAIGRMTSRTDAADSVDAASVSWAYDSADHATDITAANGVTTSRRYDDFGRKVMEVDPDHGVTLFRYDAADHLIARIDETSVATRFTFDHANRLLAVGADEQPNLTQYQYRGRQLVRVLSTSDGKPEHTTERTDYQRDAFGRVIKETRWLASVDLGKPASGLTFITTSDYDIAGRVINQTLPDGHRLQYRYAQAGDKAGSRPHHRPGQLEAILFDDRIVVTDIEQSIAGGMTGYTMGNSMRQQISLDRRGRIERLRVLYGEQGGWWHRFVGWFSKARSREVILYAQANRYDEGGRLIQIDRDTRSMQPGNPTVRRSNHYSFDGMGRLITVEGNDGTKTSYRYDKGGNRIAEVSDAPQDRMLRAISQRRGSAERNYHYAPGSNRLLAVTQRAPSLGSAGAKGIVPANSSGEEAQMLSNAWIYHPTGVQLAQLQWENGANAASRRIVYNASKRPVEVYANDQLIARYYYNSRGERIAKTTFPVKPVLTTVTRGQTQVLGDTMYSVFRDQRIAAETDGAGRITAHYIYLFGKPVATIKMATNDSRGHRLWKALTMRTLPDASDTLADIYAIVTDHLGTPQQVMDERQSVVWQAETTSFGVAHVMFAAASGTHPSAKPFVMNLRLSGQFFDAETTLHYNYLRDYDPAVGRYTTPDPADLGGGLNPYAYVSNNPLTNIDPLGLYEEDIHYYMTYFLALAAGVDPRRAYIIATGAQYVDDNPITQPMTPSLSGSFWQIVAHNSEQTNRLASYHFTERVADDWSQNAADRYIMDKKPENAQLQLLQTAANNARKLGGDCAGDVMFGEYLHAFEDTFGHRDKNDVPIQINSGWGHAAEGHSPDHTYNQDLSYMRDGMRIDENWKYNEVRTLEMEKEVFEKLARLSNGKNNSQTWDVIKDTLVRFNKVHEDSSGTDHFSKEPSRKIDILNVRLSEFGYNFIGMDGKSGDLDLYNKSNGAYDSQVGKNNRKNFLKYNNNQNGNKAGDAFSKNDPSFRGTILP